MKTSAIRVGDMLRLKRNNPYGLPPGAVLIVTAIQTRAGYSTPWIYCDGWGHFRPSDFQGHA